MFEILLTACLATSAVCNDRLIPVAAATRTACDAVAQERAASWGEIHNLTVSNVRCTDTPPALPVEEIAAGVFVHQAAHGVPTPENAGDLANLGFVVGNRFVGVIDSGGSRHVGEKLYASIRQVTDLPIGWLVVTQAVLSLIHAIISIVLNRFTLQLCFYFGHTG